VIDYDKYGDLVYHQLLPYFKEFMIQREVKNNSKLDVKLIIKNASKIRRRLWINN